MPVRMLPEPPEDRRLRYLNTILHQHTPHGTLSAYVRGCHCDECLPATRLYQRAWRFSHVAPPWHPRRALYLRAKGAA